MNTSLMVNFEFDDDNNNILDSLYPVAIFIG